MSKSFIEAILGSTIGIGLYYLLETAFYEVKYRLAGKRYENFLDEWEEEHVTF
jgi:hypothetical protein